MEFAPCKSGVKDIRYLKDNAKALGRAKGIALHKSLDAIAREEGFPGGWQDLVTSRWTLDRTMQLHKLDMTRQCALTIVFEGIKNPEILDGAKGLGVNIDKQLIGGKPRDLITFNTLNNDAGIISDLNQHGLFEQAVSEKKIRSRCRLLISLAEQILQDPSIAQSITMNATAERLINDIKVEQNLLGKSPMNAGKFVDSATPILYEAFPSRTSVKEVVLIYVLGQTARLLHIDRDRWLDVMTETVTSIGDPRVSRDACIVLLEGLGVTIPSDADITEQRRDGLEEGP